MRPITRIHMVAFISLSLLLALSPLAMAETPGLNEYLEGLDLLESGDFASALPPLQKAVGLNPENIDYLVAQGVALAFAERLGDARKALDRANRLAGARNKTIKLWLATVVAMQGDFQNDSLIYPPATRDPYESAVREMSRKYGEVAFRKTMGDPLAVQQARPAHAQAKAQFASLAKQFAAKAKPSGAQLGGKLKDRGIQRYKAGQYAAAYRDLHNARLASPIDIEVLFYYASAKLALGALEGARADYTAVLLAKPIFTSALLGRIFAHARLGDKISAQNDLRILENTDPKLAAAYRGQIEKELRGAAQPGDPRSRARLLNNLMEAIRQKSAPGQRLAAMAQQLIKAYQNGRLRSDERYQNRLNELRARASRPEASADDFTALGQYLYTEALIVLGEAVEPHAVNVPYRPQTAGYQRRELAMAEAVLDAALKKNPNHARALAFKAGCRLKLDSDWRSAETLIYRALDIAPRDHIVLDQLSLVLDYIAFVASANAARLKAVDTWEDATYIYYRYPSQAELAEAARLEAMARRLWGRARQALQTAAAETRNTAVSHYYLSILAEWDRDLPRAAAELRKAVELDDNYFNGWQRLSLIATKLGQTVEAYQAQFKASNLKHTTAAPMLKLGWIQLDRTAFNSAEQAISRGESIDAADPRIAAYRGVIAREKGDLNSGAAWMLTAAVLEEERLRQLGLYIRDKNAPDYAAEQIARMLAINNAAADLLNRVGRFDEAMALMEANYIIYGRVPLAQKYTRSPYGILPAVLPDPGQTPEAPTIEALTVWSAVYGARARMGQGRFNDAKALFQWAMAFESRKPPTMDQGMAVRIPGLWAKLGLAELEIKQGNLQMAADYLRNFGHPSIMTPDMQNEMERLRTYVESRGHRAGGDTYHDKLERMKRKAQQGY